MTTTIESLKRDTNPVHPQSLKAWKAKHSDEKSCWLILRVVHCKIHWLGVEDDWQRSQGRARWWSEREPAYQYARNVSGLLYLYDSGGVE